MVAKVKQFEDVWKNWPEDPDYDDAVSDVRIIEVKAEQAEQKPTEPQQQPFKWITSATEFIRQAIALVNPTKVAWDIAMIALTAIIVLTVTVKIRKKLQNKGTIYTPFPHV